MVRYLVPAAALAAALVLSASASSAVPLGGVPKHQRDVLRFFHNHPRLAATPAGGRVLNRIVPRLLKTIRTLQATKTAREAPVVVAHLALWRCIAGYPGARPGGGSGESGGDPSASNGSHFNVLQMTDPWDGIHPQGMSPDAIFEAAESGYRASGYSHTWLIQQWGQTLGPCWGYA